MDGADLLSLFSLCNLVLSSGDYYSHRKKKHNKFYFVLPIFKEISIRFMQHLDGNMMWFTCGYAFLFLCFCVCYESAALCSSSNTIHYMTRWIIFAHTHTQKNPLYIKKWRLWSQSCCSGIWAELLPAGAEVFAFSLLHMHRATIQSNLPPWGS